MKPLKKILKVTSLTLITLVLTSVLTGCFGRGDDESNNFQTYQGTNFSINVDPSWTILQPSDFQENIPKETLVAFTSPEAYDGFFMNVNVSKEQLQAPTNSIEYGRANIIAAEQNLTNYEKGDEAQIDLNGTPALVHIFNARLNPSEKLTRFYQLYTTQGSTGYIVTGGVLPSTDEVARENVGNMVTSFQLN